MEADVGKLFIGGISWDTDEERMKEYFGNYGEVVEAMIMRDRVTGRARGFGFVVFADHAVAERVIMDKHMIDGRTVEAKKAVPRDDKPVLNTGSTGLGRTKKIFVGGLASTVTEFDFKNYFDQFGIITDVVVMYDNNTQRPRGFGFITYNSEEAVDKVLHKTFHELNGKLVEVKRAVPKELSPGVNRNLPIGYNYGLNRASNFPNSYVQGYNLSPVGGIGVNMDGRFNPLASGRSGYPPFSTTGYGIAMNIEPGMSPSYCGNSNLSNSPGYGRMISPYHNGNSNLSNSPGYGRMISPYHNGNSNRYNTPIGYGVGNGRNNPLLNSRAGNLWGNVGLSNATNASSPASYLGSGNGSFGSLGNSGTNWHPSLPSRSGGNASGYARGSADNNYSLGGGGYGRNVGTVVAPTSSFAGSTGNIEGSYEDLYRSGSVYGDSTWKFAAPELDDSSSFGYGLGNTSTDVTARTSEDYVGSYSVTARTSEDYVGSYSVTARTSQDYVGSYSVASRQSNRGIAA